MYREFRCRQRERGLALVGSRAMARAYVHGASETRIPSRAHVNRAIASAPR